MIYKLINREILSKYKGFNFESISRRQGGLILELDNINKTYGENIIINSFSYSFRKNEKIGIFAGNGKGETTLLDICFGSLKFDSGIRKVWDNTVFGYYKQNPETDDRDITLLEYIKGGTEIITLSDGYQLPVAKFLEKFGYD